MIEEADNWSLEEVKRPRTEKQEVVAEALDDNAVILTGGQTDVQPALEAIREEHGQDYTTKGYLWQIRGEFFAVVKETGSTDAERLNEEYRRGYRDGYSDAQE